MSNVDSDDARLEQLSLEDEEEPLITHWCIPVIITDEESTQAWPTCDPFREYCNGGDSEKEEEWTCPHERERHYIKFGDLAFDDWYAIQFGDAKINPNLLKKLKIDYEEHIQKKEEANKDIYCMNEHLSETDNKELRSHWCERVKSPGEIFWASCNPYDDMCNGGSNSGRIGENEFFWSSANDEERTSLPWLDNLGFNSWVKIKYGHVDTLTKEKIWKEYMDRENSSNECLNNTSDITIEDDKELVRDEKEECKRVLLENLLDEEWFKGTASDDDDIEGILDYLELQGNEEFTDPDDEAYEQRRCKLLGIPYKRPPPIIVEKYEFTRYHLGPEEKFCKIRKVETNEYLRTAANVAWMRHNLMKDIEEVGEIQRPP